MSSRYEPKTISAALRRVEPALEAVALKLEAGPKETLQAALVRFSAELKPGGDANQWALAAIPALRNLRVACASVGVELGAAEEAALSEWEEAAEEAATEPENAQKARNWIASQLPVFVYLDDFADMPGHQNIATYLHRVTQGQQNEADHNVARLCKVAGLDPAQLHALKASDDHETRNQLVNRAGSVVTAELRRLWKDRQLKVRFNLDGDHLETYVSDPNALYDVEVNLDERSRGLRWFFSFYIAFAADTAGGLADNAILLLDEPGLFLHALSQQDLQNHFEVDFPGNQIIYTTHSPFMVPVQHLERVRTANISQDAGTVVTNDPSGDTRTLFSLQSALGYSLSQSLFLGGFNLVVEGVTDFWILSAVSSYLADEGRRGLDDRLTITPAGGAQRVSYMVALLASEQLNVLVLLDWEKKAEEAKAEMVKTKLVREDHVLFTSEAFATPPSEADVEDLLDPDVYEGLVRVAYADELRGKDLEINPKVPRTVKRHELAFEKLGLSFNKSRVARLFVKNMATKPEQMIPTNTADRFETLFGKVNARLDKTLSRGGAPFQYDGPVPARAGR
jgi:hypothetical protein